MRTLFLLIIIHSYLIWTKCLAQTITNPYEILGVKRTASINEIKRNYRNLIKVWHPDTNLVTDTKFIEITEAYKLLTDPERREDFDKHQITVDTPNFRQKPDYSRLKRFEIEDEDYFQDETNNSKPFRLNHKDILYKQTISHKAYSNKIVPASAKYPQLILFYSDSSSECPLCSTAAVIWQRITNELQSIGIHLHTINVDKDYKLTQKIGVTTNRLPAIIGVVEETVRFYKDDQITSRKVVTFIRRIIRSSLVKKINHENYREFLDGWRFDNKIRLLFINQDKNVRLRYLVTAYKYRDYAVCGHVMIENSNQHSNEHSYGQNQTYLSSVYQSATNFMNIIQNTKTNQDILNKYRLDSSQRYMLIFNENISWPVALLSGTNEDFKPKTMWESIEMNKFLLFPKITSQVNFEEICPVESVKNRRILCSILIVSKKDANIDGEMNEMRDFIKRNMFNRNKFKFGYITIEDQKPFLSALITNQTRNSLHNNHSFKKYFNDENTRSEVNENSNAKDIILQSDLKLYEYKFSVIVITRRRWDHILFEWLDAKWNTKNPNFTTQTQTKLYDLLIKLSSPEILNTDFSHEAKIIPLIDENEKSLFGRILYKLFILTEHLNDHFTRREIIQMISVVVSISFIFVIGYIMQYLVRIEEQKIDENYKKLGKRRPDLVPKDQKDDSQKLFIHELKGETYYGLVRLLKPGCRTIVLLCDGESRNKLLPKFYKAAYPYRRNKTLMFAYLMVEKNINWYRRILEQALDKHKSLYINPKNCIGTVISLNGFRKYFCVYHAKHMEMHSNMNNLDDLSDTDSSDVESGNLLNKKKSPFYSKKNLLIDDFLLDGLVDWLEKLFSSKTHKYYINYWPTQMK